MDNFIKLFKGLSDRNRIRILKMLEVKPLCVCEITAVLNISTSTVSTHLSQLKAAGYITDHKEGKWVIYELTRATDNPVLHQLLAMLPGWLHDDLLIKADRQKVVNVDRNTICGI